MEYLVHIVLAVFALALAEQGVRAELEAPWAVAALAAVPFALGAYSRVLYLRGRFTLAGALWRALHWSAPALFAVAVCALGWPSTAERWIGAPTNLLGWPSPGLLLAFAPFVVYALASIDVRVRHTELAPAARAAARRFHVRMLASGLVPTACFAVGAWIVGRQPAWRANVEHVGVYGMVFVLGSVALFMLALPWILRASWDTRPLERGALRSLLEDVARAAHFRYRDFAFWRTGDMLANAAVVGIGPFDRVVLFSDVLVASLAPREIVAVLAHEIGHAKRHHVLIFIAWTGAVFLTGELAGREVESEWLSGAIVLALFAAWYKLFGWLSRRFELEADLYALRLTRDPSAIVGALERVGGAHSREKDSWRHFSTAKRIEFVAEVASDERAGRRLERKLRVLTWLGAAWFVAASALSLHRLAADLPRDRVVAALALGRWSRAEALASELGDVDPDLSQQLSLIASLSEEERGRAEIAAERALAALASGDAKEALDWLALEALSGRRSTDAAADVLAEYVAAEAEALAAGELPAPAPLEPLCGELADAWRRAAREHDRALFRTR